MKTLIFILALLFPLLLSAETQDTIKVKINKKNLVDVPKSSVANPDSIVIPNTLKQKDTPQKDEYELIVFDPLFNTFLSTQPSKEYYSIEYLKAKNDYLVREWNMRYNSPSLHRRDVYGSYIDYNANTDYGLDFEYKLYMFFKYMEQAAHIHLSPSGELR